MAGKYFPISGSLHPEAVQVVRGPLRAPWAWRYPISPKSSDKVQTADWQVRVTRDLEQGRCRERPGQGAGYLEYLAST